MRRIDSTIRAAVCAAAMAAACGLAMGQTAGVAAKPEAIYQKPLALDQQIAALVAQPAVARAHWGVMVTAAFCAVALLITITRSVPSSSSAP